MEADLCDMFVCEVGFLQVSGDRNGGVTDKGGIIKGLSVFPFWLEGGRLFRGSGEFRVIKNSQGVLLGADLHEVFGCGVGVLQGTGGYNKGANGERGTILGLSIYFCS